jgi:hypothetical protein
MNGTNHTSSIPHLLIPDGILNGPIQVRVSFRYQIQTRNALITHGSCYRDKLLDSTC